MGTYVVSFILLAIVAAVIAYMVRQRKKGMCAGCNHCASGCPHHKDKTE